MLTRLLLLVLITAVLSGLYAGYRSSVVPLVQVTQQQVLPRAVGQSRISQPPENQRIANAHLRTHAWVTDARYQLKMQEGLIFTNERKLDKQEGVLRLRPFAAILEFGDQDTPYTVVSDSAVLNFSGEIDFAATSPGRVVSAALEGAVSIHGPDGLVVEGRNFVFWESASRIWSDEPLRFQYQTHHGTAHGLQVELIPEQPGASPDKPAIAGLRSIRLRQDVDLTLQPEPGEAPVKIRAAGSFYFFLDSLMATFDDDVLVYQPTDGEKQFDWMRCNALDLWFQSPERWSHDEQAVPDAPEQIATLPEVPRPPPRTKESSFTGIDGPLKFRRLRATGSPVLLASQKNALQTESDAVTYDAAWRVLRLSDESTVRVRYELNELRCRQVGIRHDDQDELVAAACEGPGWLENRDAESGSLAFAADWASGMRYRRGGPDSMSMIELLDEATVRRPAEQMGLGAEHIHVLMTESGGTSLADLRSASATDSPPIQVHQVLAERNVAVLSPRFQAETEYLEIQFHDNDPSRPDRDTVASSTRPDDRVQQVSLTEQEADDTGRDRMAVRADRILAEAVPRGEKTEFEMRKIVTSGNVDVRRNADDDGTPVQLTGDRLQLDSTQPGEEIVHLSGSPAHIRGAEVALEGHEIHLDRRAGLLHVRGVGQLQLPIERDLQGRELDEPRFASITWEDDMQFEGRACVFLGNVEAHLEKSEMRCHRMRVLLTEAIDFQAPDDTSGARDIDSITCEDGVEFLDAVYDGPKLTETRRVKVWQFDYERESGRTTASGPGTITIFRRGQARKAGLAPASAVRANRALKTETAEWEQIHVDFAGKMVGNVKQRYTTFNDRVRIVYGPVQRPNELIDPDHMPDGAGWMRCESLQMSQTELPEGRTAVQLHGHGNAEIEGNDFRARADAITYDESKGLYMLRSLGSRKATIWRQVRAGTEWDAGVDAQRMEFIPARNLLRLDHATEIQGLQ